MATLLLRNTRVPCAFDGSIEGCLGLERSVSMTILDGKRPRIQKLRNQKREENSVKRVNTEPSRMRKSNGDPAKAVAHRQTLHWTLLSTCLVAEQQGVHSHATRDSWIVLVPMI